MKILSSITEYSKLNGGPKDMSTSESLKLVRISLYGKISD